MQPYPIRVDPDWKDDKLDALSRLDFGKPATIHHNVKVKSYGMVNRDYIHHLVTQFKNVMLEDNSRTAQPLPRRAVFQEVPNIPPQIQTQYQRALKALMQDGWSYDEAFGFLAPLEPSAGYSVEMQAPRTITGDKTYNFNSDSNTMQQRSPELRNEDYGTSC